jgi:peroxiredoxin/tetratricopeptide (TPR) repeat protein
MTGSFRAIAIAVATAALASAQTAASDAAKLGHSSHGTAFDSGPRQKPWIMEGIGSAPFPITTKNPEVQMWFNQGNAMLHSFYFYEAERAFRWCVKLEPDNAMAYWGLANATDGDRAKDFLREAVKRKDTVTERERLYIEALQASLLPKPSSFTHGVAQPSDEGHREQIKKLETICLKYPDDMEARAYLALATIGNSRYGAELIIREVLAKEPMHPGAHHYRIHNWDYHEPQEALESCRKYAQAVPNIGHAQHMPGHIYSILGMWNEAAISMDSATRVEKRQMTETLTFPFNNWNYGHNRNYLSYIQEQLGMVAAAIFGARQLIDAPLDPDENNENWHSSHSYGLFALARALLRSERWDELVDGKIVPWRDIYRDKCWKAYFEARAWLGKGEPVKAEKSIAVHAELKKDLEKNKDFEENFNIQQMELDARLTLATGDSIAGLGALAEAAEREAVFQREYADPPFYPDPIYPALGEAYLKAASPGLAAQAFDKGLELTHNDLFSLSGLVRAYTALGDKAKAQDAMARLLYVARNADSGLKPLELAKAAGISAEPRAAVPAPERDYARADLAHYGPPRWEPYEAPPLEVRDASGNQVSLADYKGKNVILVFYLGFECPHCMRQLHAIQKRNAEWESLDSVVLAVSSASPQENADGIKQMGDLAGIRLLSDDNFANARRFHSYDDFEEIELHSTILVDKQGRVYWARFGGDPFGDLDFISKQLGRMNELVLADKDPARRPGKAE